MYCELWPYVLWPLDFQIQKRIVSAETLWGNMVYWKLSKLRVAKITKIAKIENCKLPKANFVSCQSCKLLSC